MKIIVSNPYNAYSITLELNAFLQINENIESLQQENNTLKTDLFNTKYQLQLLQKDKELFVKIANEKFSILEQKIENLEKKLTLIYY
ncbi:hypothetical protein [Spiroplasma endosymbiont of Nebria brevicollis]|uniref:hypothetical protein n=1 Tax=Spiroplasma endosymbiont of Nebria brevicollis TaxID=3066284 RepID=UPI00313BB9AE